MNPGDSGWLTTIVSLVSFLARPLALGVRAMHRFLFRFTDIIPPISNAQASVIAYTYLAGRIFRAFAYRNIDERLLVVALRNDEENEAFSRIHVLEEFGRTYREIWRSDPILPSREVVAVDVDRDGYKEVVFVEESFGTGGGLRELHIYSTTRRQLLSISESYDWQSAGGPVAPTITTHLDAEENLVRAVERYAVKSGFLKGLAMDMDNPKWAVARWHALNGEKDRGKVRLHFYPGKPRFGNSVVARLDTGDVVWTAYFKGPLCGYRKSADRHFVAYSPSWIYDWVMCLANQGQRLLFGGGRPGLWTFTCEGSEGTLEHYTRAKGVELPVTSKIEVRSATLRLNEAMEIGLDDLSP